MVQSMDGLSLSTLAMAEIIGAGSIIAGLTFDAWFEWLGNQAEMTKRESTPAHIHYNDWKPRPAI